MAGVCGGTYSIKRMEGNRFNREKKMKCFGLLNCRIILGFYLIIEDCEQPIQFKTTFY
jgi:hypothetical protein